MDQASPLDHRIENLKVAPHPREFIDKILALHLEGFSFTGIGQMLHISKNSVAGILHRERKRNNPEAFKARKQRAVAKAAAYKPRPRRVIAKPRPQKKRIRLQLIDSANAVTFAELEPHHCKFPMGDPKYSDFRFCGGPRSPGKPYCETHAHIATDIGVDNSVPRNRPFMKPGKMAT
jgi:GcrA cell cycle regulator